MSSTLVLSDVGDETWGAILEGGEVVELQVENRRRPGTAGNVYKGRVSRVLPGMQAAFVDIGIERDVFLHIADLPAAHAEIGAFLEDEDLEGSAEGVGAPVGAVPDGTSRRSRVLATGGVAIEDFLREGQEVVVQVSREAMAAKGARVTAQVGLPGRSLVYLPHLDRIYVSRRIEDVDERERLRSLTERASGGEGGWIARTAAEGAGEAELTREAEVLVGLWASIRERERRSGAPAVLHREGDLAGRLLRDALSDRFGEVIVDSDRLERIAEEFVAAGGSAHGVRVRRMESGPAGTLDAFGIHQEIERSLSPRLQLKSGGTIVVNPTEALVAIDVNSGRYVGTSNLEETVLRTNLDAVREIVRLLRLRDLGGIIVIDFIDMVESRNREALLAALQDELRKDRSRTKLLAMSDFGLVQLTRKRTRRSLDRAMQVACSRCEGSGRVRSALALYYEIERELARGAALAGPDPPRVRLHPHVAARFEDEGLRLSLAPSPAERKKGAARSGAPPPAPRIEADAALPEGGYEIIW